MTSQPLKEHASSCTNQPPLGVDKNYGYPYLFCGLLAPLIISYDTLTAKVLVVVN